MLHHSGPLGLFASKVEVALQEKVLAFAREPVPSHSGGGVPVARQALVPADLAPALTRSVHLAHPGQVYRGRPRRPA
jgi:hypothetical protein